MGEVAIGVIDLCRMLGDKLDDLIVVGSRFGGRGGGGMSSASAFRSTYIQHDSKEKQRRISPDSAPCNLLSDVLL